MEKSVCRQRISGHKLYALEISAKPEEVSTCSEWKQNCLKSPVKHNRKIANTIKHLRLIYEDKTIKTPTSISVLTLWRRRSPGVEYFS